MDTNEKQELLGEIHHTTNSNNSSKYRSNRCNQLSKAQRQLNVRLKLIAYEPYIADHVAAAAAGAWTPPANAATTTAIPTVPLVNDSAAQPAPKDESSATEPESADAPKVASSVTAAPSPATATPKASNAKTPSPAPPASEGKKLPPKTTLTGAGRGGSSRV